MAINIDTTAMGTSLQENVAWYLAFLSICAGFILFLFFRKRFNFTEFSIFQLYLLAFYTSFLVIMFPALRYLNTSLTWSIIPIIFIHYTYSLSRFTGTWFLKAVLISFFSIFVPFFIIFILNGILFGLE